MKTILFVCTGNIFRSMIAEYALKRALGTDPPYLVGSAGTEAAPQAIVPLVLDCLSQYGIDPTSHSQRRITRDLFDQADLVVAMGLDHRDFLARNFDLQVPLFNEISHQRAEPVFDTNEAIPDYATNPAARDQHIRWVVDHICNSMPEFVTRLPVYLKPQKSRSLHETSLSSNSPL